MCFVGVVCYFDLSLKLRIIKTIKTSNTETQQNAEKRIEANRALKTKKLRYGNLP